MRDPESGFLLAWPPRPLSEPERRGKPCISWRPAYSMRRVTVDAASLVVSALSRPRYVLTFTAMLDEARVLVAIAGLEDQQRPVDIADLALAAELSVSETELILRVLERRGFVGTAGDHPPRLTFAGFRELDDVRAELDLDRSARQAADRPREMEYVSSGHDLTAGQWDVIHGVDRASSNGSVVWVHGPAASGKSTAAVDLAADSMEDVFVDVSHAAPDGDLAELADQYYEPDEWVSWGVSPE